MAKKKADKPVDLNTEILRQIRDGITQLETRLTARIDATNERLEATRADLVEAIGETNDRLDATNQRLDRLERRMTETEMRLGTQHAEVLGALEKLEATLSDGFARDQLFENHEQRIDALERKAAS